MVLGQTTTLSEPAEGMFYHPPAGNYTPVENAMKDLAYRVDPRLAPRLGRGQRFKRVPLGVSDIGLIKLSVVHSPTVYPQ